MPAPLPDIKLTAPRDNGSVDYTTTCCPRCKRPHNLIFSKLLNPPTGLTHFAICPATGQPMLLRVDVGVTTTARLRDE